MWSQRDPKWSGQLLGGLAGATIGQYGCLLTCFADVAHDAGVDTDPGRLNQLLTQYRRFTQGDLLTDEALASAYPQAAYLGTYHCEGIPCDPAQLEVPGGQRKILGVDFDHDPRDGLQVHFVVDIGKGLIRDPWYGSEEPFANHYGDPRASVFKVITYRVGPAAAPEAHPLQPPVSPTQESRLQVLEHWQLAMTSWLQNPPKP